MINLPHAPELLVQARRTLLDELLPALPTDKMYEVRMVANAMAIAAREIQLKHAHEQHSLEEIVALLGPVAGTGDSPAEQRLADAIKRRVPSSLDPERLFQLLLALTTAKLAISNPKYLQD